MAIIPERFDAIVLGAGQAGGPLSTALAQSGRHTALIEERFVGGTCINDGCTPTKTMAASARVAYLARRASDFGVQTGPVKVDLGAVVERKRALVESWRDSSQRRMEQTPDMDLIFGHARFTGPKTLEINLNAGGTRQVVAEQIFINVGARPQRPAIPGLETITPLDSTSVMELNELPEHLLVVGGGYVALEFSQMFRRFGSQVTIIERMQRLTPREDVDVSEALANMLREDGIELILGSEISGVGPVGPGVMAEVKTAAGQRFVAASHLLLAAGRTSNVDRLDLAAAGIESDERGLIKVNPRLETSVPGVFAMGDVKDGPWFTHISYDDFRIVRTNVIEGGNASTAGRMVPYTVFTDPQLARIGLSVAEARAAGRKIRVAKMPMAWVARAIETGETRGFLKAVVDADNDQILGCAILGVDGGELMAMLQIAMLGNVPWTTLRNMVFAHPTLAESLNNLFGNWEAEAAS
ncbi:MAG: mercuric reductase [Chloroflexi bacterium]|nr:mercuric reductase [Chloroflexota bacterium]